MQINIPSEILDQLKNEIKRELIAETRLHPPIIRTNSGVWDEIKGMIIERTPNLDNYQKYQLISAFSCIFRYSLNINQAKDIPRDKADSALRMTDTILRLMTNLEQEQKSTA